MNDALAKWISDAEALKYTLGFRSTQIPTWLSNIQQRSEDFYISLVGELYERMREPYEDRSDWARLANALAHFAEADNDAAQYVNALEARLFAAGAFYIGGFPASAYLTMRKSQSLSDEPEIMRCEDFLCRPSSYRSEELKELVQALLLNRVRRIREMTAQAQGQTEIALIEGPDAWIPARLFQLLLEQFNRTNLRVVLPKREKNYWLPLVRLFLSQSPPRCEFFPSQIEAINKGLLESSESFSLQMPTGAGKTTLAETLFFDHLSSNENSVAVLLVPYRSLAAELKKSLVRHMGRLGFRSTAIYGGTVPVGEEAASLESVRALIATPEALSGLLSANPAFFGRITLLVVDEGHLLDSDSRGVCLELILARFRARKPDPPRFVFLSAIVPNIEEINTWLGGSESSVVRSEYRPAIAEFATLRPTGQNAATRIDLEINAAEEEPFNYRVDRFLDRERFTYLNPESGRQKTYKFTSNKTQAIATARMALPMGSCAVFATQKTGNQGAIALAEELFNQLKLPLRLPTPEEFADDSRQSVAKYLEDEYGDEWIGTRIVTVGGAMHHGDIPQETREVIEKLIRDRVCPLIVCTSTLAEGVNLPVRTLVLYSVVRRTSQGQSAMLLRDIKNLVGRAGRPGSNTKGLVICINESDWTNTVQQIARQATVEPVHGALAELLSTIIRTLESLPAIDELTNAILEHNSWLHALVDGVDATLIELAAQELGGGNFKSWQTRLLSRALQQRKPMTVRLTF
ncbi:DEAD/DEAH box helicase [Gimesia maris]|uniref:DEAD/DEAH box helicase n=1 Tax=Gimesia maris TaxID=122 RepID=UPI003A8E0D06